MMKYEYTNSNIEWIGKYPKHWKVFRISQRVESVVGGEWGSEPDTDDSEGSREIVVLRVSDFNDIYLNYDNLTIRRVKETKIPNRLISENCLIMEKSGGGEKQLVGRVAEAKDLPFEAITSNFIAKLEFDSKVDNHFMNYVFHDLYNSNLNFPFVQQTTGIQNINSTYYLYTKVPFPPKPEQIGIANYLDKACANIERVVEIKRKQIENLQQQLKSIIHHSVTKGLNPKAEMKESGIDWIGEVPKHWKVERLKDISRIVETGSTPPTAVYEYYESGSIPWYGPSSFNGEIYLTEPVKLINEIARQYGELKMFEAGSLMIIGIGATIGKVALISEPSSCNQQINIFTPDKKILPEFLLLFMKRYEDIIIQIAQFTTLPIFNQTRCGSLNIAIPPKNEQTEIISYIKSEIEKVKTAQSKIEKQIEVLLNYKKSLIHEVVTGKKQVYGITKEKQQMQSV